MVYKYFNNDFLKFSCDIFKAFKSMELGQLYPIIINADESCYSFDHI